MVQKKKEKLKALFLFTFFYIQYVVFRFEVRLMEDSMSVEMLNREFSENNDVNTFALPLMQLGESRLNV